jgi:hypothetical protein
MASGKNTARIVEEVEFASMASGNMNARIAEAPIFASMEE